MECERIRRMASPPGNAAQIIQRLCNKPAIIKAVRDPTDFFKNRRGPVEIPGGESPMALLPKLMRL